mmetsp:Transcript_80950/g.161390  ORF Transcript_80950/g.161390 Transcript_80950/m.161390 type:complete len:229 (+) Transcript_80950:247-933(+)
MSDSKQNDTDEDEFEILMDTLAHLEDMLFDEVVLDGCGDEDEAWNVVASKTGEGIREELKEFEERWALPAFIDHEHERSVVRSPTGVVRPTSEQKSDGKAASEVDDRGNFEDNGAMFTVEQYSLHKRFAALVESHVEKFLGGKYGFNSVEKLLAAINRASAPSGSSPCGQESGFKFIQNNWARDAGREVLSVLSEVDDFELWAREMTQKARQKKSSMASLGDDRQKHK